MKGIVILLAGVLPLLPFVILGLNQRRRSSSFPNGVLAPEVLTRRLVISVGSINLLLAVLLVGAGTLWFLSPATVHAAGIIEEPANDAYRSIAAAIAVAAGSFGAAYAVSTVGSAAVGAIAEKPEVFGRALIFVGLAEGVAIYGLIIAFIILGG
ncbi:MAG: hypothetical protein JXA33_09070 [Anaerolineae bacterium]|nr:hypothetical protein [Anaerolineae bacterium]